MTTLAAAEPARLGRAWSFWARLCVLLAATGVAYHFSLTTLVDRWNGESPLADLVLVPLLAAALFIVAALRHPYVGAVKLGAPDVVVGGAALVASLAALVVLPVLLSKYFWAMRLDLVALPLFAASAVALLFGLRAVLGFLFPLAFLLLAWPLPYTALLERMLGGFTEATDFAVAHVVSVLPVAEPVPGTDASRYLVDARPPFVVDVGSACSGVNSLLGFGIVAAAVLYCLRGPLHRKAAWLTTGLVLVYAFNIVRIVVVLAVGRYLGRAAALDALHPVAGIVAVNAAVVILFRRLSRFRLAVREVADADASDSPLARAVPIAERATARALAPRLVVLAVFTTAFALVNGGLAAAAAGYDPSGSPPAAAFGDRPSLGRDWAVRRVGSYPWAESTYGHGSSWLRFQLVPSGRVALPDRFTVWLDDVRTRDLAALDAQPVSECYRFHGFPLSVERRVALGNGVVGELYVYRDAEATWHALAWQWPVSTARGVEQERIVLLASTPARPKLSGSHVAMEPTAGAVLRALNVSRPARDPNDLLSGALTDLAARIVRTRLAA